MKNILPSIFALGLAVMMADAGEWPAFRGPQGNGIAEATSAPVHWGPDKNIRWKIPLPQPGNGSPIVVGNRVLVTSVEDAEGKQRSLYSFDAETGEQQWVQTVVFDRKMPTHKTNPYAATTPVSDGRVVAVWHGSAGLHVYDLAGRPLWKHELGSFQHIWGYGTSPIIHEGQVILHSGPGKERIFVASYDAKTGEQRWLTEEKFSGDGEYNANKQYMGSWATPVIAKGLVVVTQPTRIVAYDPKDGSVAWFCNGVGHARGDLAYSSPTIAGEVCFVTGGFRGPMLAVKMDGQGDLSSKRLWRMEKQPQSIGSAVYVDGYLYRPNAGPGSIQCIDIHTGAEKWMDRSVRGDYWASVIQVGEHLYATNQEATTVVFKANPARFEQVALNELKARCNATPAAAKGRLYFRTFEHLLCVDGEGAE